jgi:hypothetical protein
MIDLRENLHNENLAILRDPLNALTDKIFNWLKARGVHSSTMAALNGPIYQTVKLKDLYFEAFPNGAPAILIPEWRYGTLVGFVAWDGHRTAMSSGHETILGMEYLGLAYDWLKPIRVFKTPLDWLVGDGDGICIIDTTAAWRTLLDFNEFLVEDREHASQLAKVLSPRKTEAIIYIEELRVAA